MDGRISIDSLKVRIPLNQVEVIDKSLHSKVLKVREDTGEILGEIKNSGLAFKEDGISTHYVLKQVNVDGRTKGDFLVILCNAKLLRGRYFEGLTSETIETVYYRLMEHSVVRFSLDALLDGLCTDVDIKRDIRFNDFDSLIRSAIGHTKPSKKKDEGYHSKNRHDNRGIEWGSREGATATHPFYKVYDKARELLYHSITFYEKYLKGKVDITDLARVEGTIKNKEHFKRYGITDTSLRSLLEAPQNVLEDIFKDMYTCWLDRNLKPPKSKNKMTPEERIYYNTINLGLSAKFTYGEIVETVLDGLEENSRATKGRKRDLMKSVYQNYIQGSKPDKDSQEVLKGHRFMGMP